MDEFGHTQEVLAKALGKSRSHIANMLRLLTLPLQVKQLVQDGAHRRPRPRLAVVEDPVATAQQVIEKGLNVRQVEQLVRETHGKRGKSRLLLAAAPPIGTGPAPRAASAPGQSTEGPKHSGP